MSKIAEEKALEAYPVNEFFNNERGMLEDSHRELRIGYEEGYDQAMQDFMEKACYYLKSTLQEDDETNDFIVQQFKNYMKNE